MTTPPENERLKQRVEAIRAEFERKVQAIRKKGAERVRQITDDAPDPSDFEAALNFTFDVRWKITSIKFDVPRFSMEREVIKFDIPEVRMETEEMSFDVPATRMVNKCVAKKPEFYGFPPKIKWTCIYTKVPEVYMRRVSFKTDIPKFNSKRTEVKFDKPVARMETTELKLHLPQFYLKKLDVQIESQKREFEEVSSEMTSEISAAQAELKQKLRGGVTEEVAGMFERLRAEVLAQRGKVAASYDDAIAKTKTAIKSLKQNNAADKVRELELKLGSLVSEYQGILQELDGTIEELNKEEEEAIRGLVIP